ncbi:pirin (plasmid) [Paracidovorax citrulli]|uniref:replication protein RepA n=1 Tax=Paracidovorax citrulli TaxID=80869 RepID=UPI0002DE8116|nr:replication protein RepA [Paracidovorax citrulli]QCX13191.1 Plasmid replication protein RepA [Paracidovorax citrulli]UMT93565.1 pirin [Paracidovorax citrulli]
MNRKTSAPVSVDYKRDEVPEWIREVIETGLAIEQEDARSAGSLGFMTRALVNATMPYKDPKTKVFERRNGDLTLTILAPNGVPYGKYPRLLVSYLVTEAVATRSNVVVLGETLAQFLRATIGVRATGGQQGTQTRLSDQMQRLFTSIVTVGQRVTTETGRRAFQFENIQLIERGRLEERDMHRLDSLQALPEGEEQVVESELWRQVEKGDAGRWNSVVELTPRFFQECVETPVPLDLRAYKVLSEAPMAMDIYAWTTYRASYIKRPTRPIPWQVLQAQFGSGLPMTEQGTRDFKKAFKRNLDLVRMVHPGLKVDESSNAGGLVLLPSPTSVKKLLPSAGADGQQPLF